MTEEMVAKALTEQFKDKVSDMQTKPRRVICNVDGPCSWR